MIAGPTGVRIAGDSPPPPVADVFRAVADGRYDEAAVRFAADAVYAFGVATANERAPREVVTGRAQIAAAPEADLGPPGVPELLVCVSDGRDCLLEGRLVDPSTGSPIVSIAVSIQLDEAGSIRRLLSHRVQPVEPSESWAVTAPTMPRDARSVLARYFTKLEAGDAAGAAACFSTDVRYSYPQAEPGLARSPIRGRDELLAAFGRRGRQRWRHRVLVAIQSGSECIVEGDVDGIDAGGTGGFISSLPLDADGLIARYSSFYAEPAVPRVGTTR